MKKMVIFHSYVKLPEGRSYRFHKDIAAMIVQGYKVVPLKLEGWSVNQSAIV